MPMPMLNTLRISSSLIPPSLWISAKILGTSHERESTTASTLAGNTRLRLPARPPPVMWATRVHIDALLQSEDGGCVDHRRLEQLVGQRVRGAIEGRITE